MSALSAEAVELLGDLLRRMHAGALDLEAITQKEYKAIREMDGETLLRLAEERAACHQALEKLEQECRRLLAREDVPQGMRLQAVIERDAGSKASELEALRRDLYQRIKLLDRQYRENRMRMYAAYSVASSLLQQLGLDQAAPTYGPGGGG